MRLCHSRLPCVVEPAKETRERGSSSVLLYVGTVRGGEPRTATSTFTQLLSSESGVQCCFKSTETIRTVRDREPRTSTSTFTQLQSSVQSPFFSGALYPRETIRTVRDGEPRAATSTFTLLLSSVLHIFQFSVALHPHRPC